MKLIKFSTPNCPACKAMGIYLHNLQDLGMTLDILEVDCTDGKHNDLVIKYNITSVPTLVKQDTGELIIGFSPLLVDKFLSNVRD